MKGFIAVLCVLVLVTGALAGCGPQKAQSSSAAIEQSKTLQTSEKKVSYLMGQAQAFYNSKEFQQSIDVARYVLNTLDKDSQQAKKLIEDATAKLKAAATGALDDAKKSLNVFGK